MIRSPSLLLETRPIAFRAIFNFESERSLAVSMTGCPSDEWLRRSRQNTTRATSESDRPNCEIVL